MFQPILQRSFLAALRFACVVLACSFALVYWHSTRAQAPAVGAMIDNQAFVDYTTASGKPQRVGSNIVSVRVGQVSAFVLTASQERFVAPGAQAVFAHTLQNTGNGIDTFSLSFTNNPGAFNFTNIQLFADANGDGIADNATPLSTTVTLAAGQSMRFVVVASTPAIAQGGQRDQFTLSAQGSTVEAMLGGYTPAASQTNIDGATIALGPVIELDKTFSISAGSSPSATPLTVEIKVRNSGFAAASNVLISDAIPGAGLGYNTQGLSYVAGSATWNGLALTDAPSGDPAGVSYEYATTGSFANTVRAVLASLPAGGTGTLRFKVNVASALSVGSDFTRNIAQASYHNGVQQVTQPSNLATYTVIGRSLGADLTLSKVATAMVVPGQCTVFQLQVRNIGTLTSSGALSVVDTLPAGLEYQPSCVIQGVNQVSGGVGWSCPSSATTGAVTCTSAYNVAAQIGNVAGVAPLLKIVVRANAASLVPPLPAVTAVPNTVTVLNRAVVSNALESVDLRDNNSASATLVVGPAATVRGNVWRDIDHNRVLNLSAGDLAVEGWVIELSDRSSGLVVATTTTAANGSYEITSLLPGQYRVKFIDPVSRVVYGRPVCNEMGMSSAVTANCAMTQLSRQSGTRDPQGDSLWVDLAPGDTITQMSLPLDPSGVVYDSITRAPVAGAVVTLQMPAGFNAANFLIGGAANVVQTTGASGGYQYILTTSGVAYCNTLPSGCAFGLVITAPANYRTGVSQFLPPSPSLGACAELNCLDPTGLGGSANVFAVQSQNTAPAIGQTTPYYLRFQLTAGDPDVVNNHIPLDPISAFGENLLIEKKASRPAAEVGDFVDYTVTVKNGAITPLQGAKVIDQLPAGFRFVVGTTKLGGVAYTDPAVLAPGKIQWALPLMAAGQTLTLTYRVRIEFAASSGDGINRVTAVCLNNAIEKACSNTAQAKVQITDGVLSGKPFIIGKVFLDCNRDRLQSDREVGVPGVRLFLQDGTYVVTDVEGKFSLYGLSARTYALKLDPLTLPVGWEGEMVSNRNAGDSQSRFVDLKTGELQKANFADGACHADTVSEVHRRREAALNAAQEGVAGTADLWNAALDVNTSQKVIDLRAQAAAGTTQGQAATALSGVINSPQSVFASAQAASTPALPAFGKTALPLSGASVVKELPSLEKALETANNTLGFMNLVEGQVLPIAQTHVQIKAAQGATVVLSVNGVNIPDARVGKRSTNESTQTQGWEYIAVPLRVGKNELSVAITDAMGNPRGRLAVNVVAPGDLAQIKVSPLGKLTADSRAINRVRLALQDQNGVPVTPRTQITLKLEGLSANVSSPARITTVDLDPNEDGVQIFAVDGVAVIDLAAPDTPTNAKLRVQAGTLKQTSTLSFLPNLRPMVGVGLIDGAIALHKLKASQLGQNGRSHFEDELRCFGRPTMSIAGNAGQWDCLSRDFGEKASASVQAALYFKGAVKGEYLLTLAYDNAKDVKARVFRDISPDEYYPVYGDSSQRGFDANSTEKLFVRVDRGNEFFLYGDFSTQSTQSARQLTQYSRTITGVKTHVESADGRGALEVFATRDSLKQKVMDIAANGTSGPFSLSATGVVNSEKIEVLVRDRNASSTVLKRTALTRFVDYEIEPYTGRLILRAPLASLDANLNPVSLHIVFEQDDALETAWTLGAQATHQLNDAVEVGAVAVQERRAGDGFGLYGVHATVKLDTNTALTSEIGRTIKDDITAPGTRSAGNAARVELTRKTPDLDARLQLQKTQAGFNNLSSSSGPGKTEVAGKIAYKLTPTQSIAAEVLHNQDDATQASRSGVALKLEQQFENGVKLDVGVRKVESHEPAAVLPTPIDDAYTSLRAKVTAPLGKQTDAYLEAEQATDSARKLLAVGADYRLANRGRVYARHEFANTLGGDFSLTSSARSYSTVLGLDAPLTDSTQAFSEYRLRDAIGGGDAQAALGLRQTWLPMDGMRLNTSFERTQTLASTGAAITGPSTAATLGANYVASETWKATGRLEWRTSHTQTSWLNTLGYAYKVDRDWTMIARSVLSMQHTAGTTVNDINKSRVQLGMAYRDTDRDIWNGLAKIEQRSESDTALSLKRTVNLLSAHANYQVDKQWWLSGHMAVKSVADRSNGLNNRSNGHLFGVRLSYEIDHEWDASVLLMRLAASDDAGGKNRKLGLGLELGRRIQENLWFAAGYNVWGVKDRDLTQNEYTQNGFYLRLRYKFDETLFDRPRDRVQP